MIPTRPIYLYNYAVCPHRKAGRFLAKGCYVNFSGQKRDRGISFEHHHCRDKDSTHTHRDADLGTTVAPDDVLTVEGRFF